MYWKNEFHSYLLKTEQARLSKADDAFGFVEENGKLKVLIGEGFVVLSQGDLAKSVRALQVIEYVRDCHFPETIEYEYFDVLIRFLQVHFIPRLDESGY